MQDAGDPPAEVAEDIAEDFGTVGRIETAALPVRKPAAPRTAPARSNAPARSDLLPARELYSRDLLDDQRAQTAMRGMSASQRLNLLCMTEMRAQLTVASPVPPEILPSFRPPAGNVLEPGRAEFRALGRWFDLAFRCETDSGVTRVEKFAFKIGREIPRSEWGSRGLSGF